MNPIIDVSISTVYTTFPYGLILLCSFSVAPIFNIDSFISYFFFSVLPILCFVVHHNFL
jgi:hypothetical protein